MLVVAAHGNGPQVGLLASQGETFLAGGLAGIGALEDAAAILRGSRRTRVTARNKVPA